MLEKPGFLKTAEEKVDERAEKDRIGVKEVNPPKREQVLDSVKKLCGAEQNAIIEVMRERSIDGQLAILEVQVVDGAGAKRFFLYTAKGRYEKTPNAKMSETKSTSTDELWYDEKGQLYFAETVMELVDGNFEKVSL